MSTQLTLVLVNADLILSCCKSRPSQDNSVPWYATHARLSWGTARPWIPSVHTWLHRRWSRFELSMRTQQCPTRRLEYQAINMTIFNLKWVYRTNDGSSPKKNGLSARSSERVVKSSLPNSTISSGLWTPMPWALTIFDAYEYKFRYK